MKEGKQFKEINGTRKEREEKKLLLNNTYFSPFFFFQALNKNELTLILLYQRRIFILYPFSLSLSSFHVQIPLRTRN